MNLPPDLMPFRNVAPNLYLVTQRTRMIDAQNIIRQLTQTYADGAWFGDTFMEKLEDVTEKEAFTRPAPDIHSIAELIAHVIYWRSPLIKALKGSPDYKGSVEHPDNWTDLETLQKRGWKRLMKDFDESQKSMIALLQDVKPTFFEQLYAPGRTWGFVVEGIVQHDIYHLGQLALVKKMVRL